MIISVHIPKTAGVSFRRALELAYNEQLYLDYGHQEIFDRLLSGGYHIDTIHRDWLLYSTARSFYEYLIKHLKVPAHVAIVHGHFPACKYYAYSVLQNSTYITWLRELFDRMVSHYFYWKKISQGTPDRFVQKIFSENWDLEKFCFCPVFRDYQSLFLRNIPRRKIAFIGVVEHYKEDLDYLGRSLLKKELHLFHENVTDSEEKKAAMGDSRFKGNFYQYHKKDYDLYRYALEARKRREFRRARDEVPR